MMDDRSVLAAFGAEHVERLTGLSRHQLREWDKVGFFAPTYAYENRRLAYSRVYSFHDIVGLRTLAVLSKKHRIPIAELKRVAAKLSKWSDTPWSSLTLYVLNREVHFHNPDTGKIEGAISGQFAAAIPLESVMEDMRRQSDKLRHRGKGDIVKIERHRYTMRNAWVVAGTRIPVTAVYSFADAGYTPKQIVDEYPSLTVSDVKFILAQRNELTCAA